MAGLGLLMLAASAAPAATVTFTLSLDTAKDPGANYTNFHAAGAGTATEFVIGFNVDVLALNGAPLDLAPVAAFCTELAEPISDKTYTFDAVHLLHEASAGRAGQVSTPSAFIPIGGIGKLRAARVEYLFKKYYHSVQLSAWTQTTTLPSLHAFQLAVWELTHDTDMNLNSTSGAIYVAAQSNTLRNNAISLAQTWLNAVAGANVTEAYESTRFDIWALTNTNGAGATGFQDILLGLEKETPQHTQLAPFLPAPEPGSVALLGTSAILMVLRRRR